MTAQGRWVVRSGHAWLQGAQAARQWRAVRFAGNGVDTWPMWFELNGTDKLRIELSAGYIEHHVDHAKALAAKLPAWAAAKPMLTFQSVWEF